MTRNVKLLLVAVAGVGLFVMMVYGKGHVKQVVNAFVEFDTFDEARHVITWTVRLDERDAIERLLLSPLGAAKVEKRVGDWQHLGRARLVYADGEEEIIWMYNPLGRFKRRDTYYKTDFSAISLELRRFADYVERRLNDVGKGK